MAAWYQGPAQSLVRGGAGSRRGRHPDPRWRTVAPAPPRQRGGLARGRAPFDRRAQVLPLELADRDAAKNPRCHHQGALALRAGPSAAQGGTWPRSLRRAILERSASPRSYEHDRLPLSAAPANSKRRNGEKNRIGPPPQPSLPAIRTAIIAFFNPGRCRRCPFRLRNSPEQHAGNLPK